jgi:hypothetical protein
MKNVLFPFLAILAWFQLVHAQLEWSSPPAVISNTGVDASDQEIAIDPNGNGVAVWVENGYIISSYLSFGGSWSSTSTLSSSGASAPQVAFDSGGNATAIWVESGVIQSSTLPFGGSWSSTPDVLSSTGASSPQLAVDGDGNAVAIWVRGDNIESNSKLSGGSWNDSPDVFDGPGASSPQVAINGGNVVAVWHSPVDSTNMVSSTSKAIGGAWNTVQLVSWSFLNSAFAKVAVDPSGNAVATWFSYNLSGDDFSSVALQSASLPIGGYWTSPVYISSYGIMNPANLVSYISLDGNGDGVAVWTMSYDGSLLNVESSTLPFGGYWTYVVEVNPTDPYAYDCNVDVVSIPPALALYMMKSTGISIQAVYKDIDSFDGIWSSPATISVDTYNAYPRIDASLLDNTLNAIAVWTGWDGSNTNVQAVTISKEILQPPTGLAVSQTTNDLNVLTEYQNVVTWDASALIDVVGYNIYRGDVFLGAVSSTDTLQFTDYNRTLGAMDSYGVSSVDAYGSESSQAIITLM